MCQQYSAGLAPLAAQNPPTFGSWGFDSPSRHQANSHPTATYRRNCKSALPFRFAGLLLIRAIPCPTVDVVALQMNASFHQRARSAISEDPFKSMRAAHEKSVHSGDKYSLG